MVWCGVCVLMCVCACGIDCRTAISPIDARHQLAANPQRFTHGGDRQASLPFHPRFGAEATPARPLLDGAQARTLKPARLVSSSHGTKCLRAASTAAHPPGLPTRPCLSRAMQRPGSRKRLPQGLSSPPQSDRLVPWQAPLVCAHVPSGRIAGARGAIACFGLSRRPLVHTGSSAAELFSFNAAVAHLRDQPWPVPPQ